MNKLITKKKLKKIGLNVKDIRFLNAGTSKNNYIIKTEKEKYILKIFRKEKKKIIQKQITLLRKINKKQVLAINPIHSKVLVFDDFVGYIYKYLEGKPYKQLKIKNKIYTFGKIIGRFNKLTKNILPPKKNNSYIEKINKEAKKIINWIKEKDTLHKKAKKLLKLGTKIIDNEDKNYSFRTQLIHGDLHYDNVFYEKGKFIIIDVDGLENSILAREITTLITYMVEDNLVKFKKGLRKLFEGYESEYKLLKKEKELFPLLMIIRKFGEIMYLLSQESKKHLNKKEIKFFLGHTTRKLDIILKNYKKIKKIFKEIS
jgi:Ser/Thr protein kinase RdoA (MazF antagonist)